MKIEAIHAEAYRGGKGDTCLVTPFFEGDDPAGLRAGKAAAAALCALSARGVFTGKTGQCQCLPTPRDRAQAVLAVGVGSRAKLSAEGARRAAGTAAGPLSRHRVRHVFLDVTRMPDRFAEAFVEGLVLAQYRFEVYRKGDPEGGAAVEAVTLIVPDGVNPDRAARDTHRAALIAMGVNGARQLADTASNDLTPSALAEFARGVARESGMSCTVLGPREMAELGMNALLGVAKGAAEEPRLVVMEYRHARAKKTILLAGKGVCFDAGGISIKPAQGMHEMKYDMCGAAAVLCAMMTLAHLGPRVNLVAVVPAVENKTGARAQTPGDIVRAYNGKTVEVRNTDAEGRLILADALAYAVEKHAPDVVVDLATLTGACVVALGHYAAGVLGNDDGLVASLVGAGEETGDRLWPLPLWDEYCDLIKGDHADLCNISPGRDAGTITGAAFIKEFVGGTPWAHIDIAGVAYGVKHIPHLNPKHATGFGVRLLTRWVMDQAKAAK